MKKEKQTSAYEYLYATIKTADWISDEYKAFAEKYKDTEEPLKELFLCICDQVSIDVLELVELNDSVADSFRKCRKSHIESEFIRRFSYDMKRLKNITTETKKEVQSMSGTVKQIADTIPTFDEMFMHEANDNASMEEKAPLNIKEINTNSANKSEKNSTVIENTKPATGLKNVLFRKFYRKRPAKYVETLIKEGYSKEQISYILDCLENGLSIDEIEKFASPKIDVELMVKLSNMRKEK